MLKIVKKVLSGICHLLSIGLSLLSKACDYLSLQAKLASDKLAVE